MKKFHQNLSSKELSHFFDNWDNLLTPEEYALKLEEDYYYALGEIQAEKWWSLGK
jgi:hypothetical protein